MTTSSKCIILDFDHTLFNTTRYVVALRDLLQKEGITHEEFDEKRHYLKSCCHLVDIDTFIQHLSVSDKALLHDVIHRFITEKAASFVFDDVEAFINHYKDDYDFFIMTQGDQELQREKITHSAIEGIRDIIITRGQKDEAIVPVVKKYRELHFIDDKTKHIVEVKSAFPHITTYHLQRPHDHPYGDKKPCVCADYEITNLTTTTIGHD